MAEKNLDELKALLEHVHEGSSYKGYVSVFPNEHDEPYIFYCNIESEKFGALLLGSETDWEWMEIKDVIVMTRGSNYTGYCIGLSNGETWVLNEPEALWLQACFKACRPRFEYWQTRKKAGDTSKVPR